MELVAQLRAGADFRTVAASNSERERNGKRLAPEDGGKVGTFEVPNLREDLAAALKNVKVGGVSDPIRTPDGYQILRVDERTAASENAAFNENQVREAITIERSPKAREDYLEAKRNESYIKIGQNYRASVAPLLKLPPEETAENAEGTTAGAKPPEKKKGKFLKIFPKP
jgi:parvulin-like peptidyl-prolyl isomerase